MPSIKEAPIWGATAVEDAFPPGTHRLQPLKAEPSQVLPIGEGGSLYLERPAPALFSHVPNPDEVRSSWRRETAARPYSMPQK